MNALRIAAVTVLVVALSACGDEPLTPGPNLDIGTDLVTVDSVDIAVPDAPSETQVGPDAQTDAVVDVVGPDAVEDGGTSDVPQGDGSAGDGTTTETTQDTSTPCTPVDFTPTGSPAGWKTTSTELFTVTQGDPNQRGQDVAATAAGVQWLIGKFAYGPFDKDLEEEDVEVFVQSDAPCGDWVSQGVLETSDDGQFGTINGVEDDGGRAFFELTGDAKRGVGVHPVRMLVHGDHSVASFNLFVFEPGTQAVLFDIDGTLTTDDFELVASLFNEIFSGDYLPDLHPGALDAVNAYAAKGYQIIYLSARPEWLKPMTQNALIQQGFPPGLVHLAETNTESLTDTANYKATFLGHLLNTVGLDIVAMYGNADTDVEAYEMAGMPKSETFIIGENAGMAGTTALADYPSHQSYIDGLPDASTSPPEPIQW